MKALIVGGTTGFGKEISEKLKVEKFEVITVGRSNADFICDIGNLEEWQKVLINIKKEHQSFELVVFVAGFARAKSFKDLAIEDWQEHFNKNFLYIAIGLQVLPELLQSVGSKVITIGSQWSYKIGNDELVPYTIAKHAVATLTQDFATRNPLIKANHYCVPTMDTPQYNEVIKSFHDIGKEFHGKELSDPKIISNNLIEHCLEFSGTSSILVVDELEVKEL